jgi:hypothetical protein
MERGVRSRAASADGAVVKLVGFDALVRTHEIALVRGWERSWQQSLHTQLMVFSQTGPFRLSQMVIRNDPADWVIYNIRLDSVPTFAGEGVAGTEFDDYRAPLVTSAGQRFDIEVEYVGPHAGGVVFEALLLSDQNVPLLCRSDHPIRRSVSGLRFMVILGEETWLFYSDSFKAEIRAVDLRNASALERNVVDEWIADEGRIRDSAPDGPYILDEPVVASMHLHRDEEREMLCAMDDRHGRCLFTVGREGASFAATYAWPGRHLPAWLEPR